MEACKPMATPMSTNLKKVIASYSKLVDPMLYRRLIGSLMYFVNNRPYMFCCEHLELVNGGTEAGALGSNKACAQILEGHSGVWS
jgi:hypothetical protein